MEKELLITHINSNLSANKISKVTGKSLSTIRYWLKKYNLKTNHETFKNRKPIVLSDLKEKNCPKCNTIKQSSEFYIRRDKTNFSHYCKSCTGLQTTERCQLFKVKCIEYKGNCCSRCGYNKYIGALEFHHLDPTQKDFSISQVRVWQFNDKVKQELDKCIILCSNCHREVHNELRIDSQP